MNTFEFIGVSKEFALFLIVLLPLAGAFANGILGKGMSKQAVGTIGVGSVALAFALALACFLHLTVGGPAASINTHLYDWFTLNLGSQTIPVRVEFVMDSLSGMMTLMVTGVGLLIHVYSLGYMSEDAGFRRFFAYLNLFMASMLILVLAGSFPLMFVGWEGVGLCSYLLIGFWFENKSYALAGKKAFVANRVGDFGVIIGMFILMMATGSLDFAEINNNTGALRSPIAMGPEAKYTMIALAGIAALLGIAAIMLGRAKVTWGWITGAVLLFACCFVFFELSAATLATAACIFIFLGCTGKSAQIPLFVWLPDAMAGPTPVSALIHAATMVTSGIYLCCRLSPVFSLSPAAMSIIAIVGAATALLAASIALVQVEMKKILAYSTVSQLGFMFAAVGCGAFAAGIFHVFTHAFFKACLFLGAGAVMHAVHAHGDADVRLLGGLRRHLPVVRWTFLASCAAISGVPLLSGWFSKDEILNGAYAAGQYFGTGSAMAHSTVFSSVNAEGQQIAFGLGPWVGYTVFTVLFIAATMTAFYMFRLYFLTFSGDTYRSAAQHSAEAGHGEGEGYAAHPHPPEPSMAWPLRILAFGALIVGFLHMKPLLHLFHAHLGDPKFDSLWEHWLSARVAAPSKPQIEALAASGAEGYAPAIMGFLAMALGIGYAYSRYADGKGVPGAVPASGLPKLVFDKWRFDEVYDAVVIEPIRMLAMFCAAIDKYFVDFLLTRFTSSAAVVSGFVLSRMQNGVVYAYGAVMVVGTLAIGGWFLKPHPALEIESQEGRLVTFSAAQGHGYEYRWDFNGDADFKDPTENEKFLPDRHMVKYEFQGHEGEQWVLRATAMGDYDEVDLDVRESDRTVPYSVIPPEGWDDTPDENGKLPARVEPSFRLEEGWLIIRPNSARASAINEEVRLAPGQATRIGGREFVAARRMNVLVQVRNAFGYVSEETESVVIVPDFADRPHADARHNHGAIQGGVR